MSEFTDYVLESIRKEFASSRDSYNIYTIIPKYIPDRSFKYQVHWGKKSGKEAFIGLHPEDYYSALLLEGIRVPVSLEMDRLKVLDGDLLYQWDGINKRLQRLIYGQTIAGVSWKVYVVKNSDRLMKFDPKLKKEYVEKLIGLL